MQKISSPTLDGLDRFDREILKIVQRDNQLSHAAIGETVGLSGSAVRRRLARLRESGVICRDISIVSPAVSGITVFVTVSFAHETVALYRAFEEQAAALPQVQQCYHIAGEADYLLVVKVPSLEFYETWAMEQFMSNEAIRRYDSTIAWSCKKFEPAASFDL